MSTRRAAAERQVATATAARVCSIVGVLATLEETVGNLLGMARAVDAIFQLVRRRRYAHFVIVTVFIVVFVLAFLAVFPFFFDDAAHRQERTHTHKKVQ